MSNYPKITCVSSSHQNLVEKLTQLQERFSHLQAARKEGRLGDHAFLEAQISQNLREWQAELTVPSPESSLLGESISNFSEEISRLLKLNDEEDDATSSLKEHPAPKPDGFDQSLCPPEHLEWTAEPFCQSPFNVNFSSGFEDAVNNTQPHDQQLHFSFPEFDPSINTAPDVHGQKLSNLDINSQLDYHLSEVRQEFNNSPSIKLDVSDASKNYTDFTTPQSVRVPPPSAFLGPKCALWDCTRPAHGSDWYLDYCSDYHGNLALNEDSPGTSPVLRPGGISLKDNLLIDALRGKTLGKNVGIPVCEGAVNTKCPWNAADLFHLELVEGETIREWLFFDKPRRAYDSGNRKQRSLPDYSGRGWHESRKLLMKEQEGQKRSYYMDPQPPGLFEWHLFEYQINESDVCALYRLELKLTNGKKSPKGRVAKDPLADLQKKMEKMGQLTPEVASDKPSPPTKGRTKSTKGVKSATSNVTQHTPVPATTVAPTYVSDNLTNEPSSHQ